LWRAVFDADALLRPWFDRLLEDLPGVALLDAHTHVGQNDPDGFKQTPEELLDALAAIDAKALVFPMHEPDGYTPANDFVMDAVARSNGTLRALCRVQPKDPGCVDEARRCLEAGVNGIKLHPRAEQFTLSEPSVRELVAEAHEHKATVLIHAGRGIPALGEDTVRLSGEFPEARMILAHCAISDLSWLWRELPDHPNLYIDTAWWAPADVLATFALCPPSNIVWASDSPYGRPIIGATQTMRMAFQAGLTPDQLRAVMGQQMEHVLAGEPRLELGPPPGAPQKALDPLIERVVTHLTTVMGRAFVRADFSEPLALARLACAVGDDAPQAEVCSAVLELLDQFDEHLAPPEDGRPIPAAARLLVFALIVARTPDVPIPALPDLPHATRAEAEAHEPKGGPGG
jgi:predicted TIM-barrel fold metal-dependent hydrolase